MPESPGDGSGVRKRLTPRKRSKRYTTDDEYAEMAERMLRAYGRRLAQADPEDLARLVRLRRVLDEVEQEAIDGLRSIGVTWSDIGRAFGMRKQSAQERWGQRSNVREPLT